MQAVYITINQSIILGPFSAKERKISKAHSANQFLCNINPTSQVPNLQTQLPSILGFSLLRSPFSDSHSQALNHTPTLSRTRRRWSWWFSQPLTPSLMVIMLSASTLHRHLHSVLHTRSQTQPFTLSVIARSHRLFTSTIVASSIYSGLCIFNSHLFFFIKIIAFVLTVSSPAQIRFYYYYLLVQLGMSVLIYGQELQVQPMLQFKF